jgi:threonine aldolase
MKPIDLRSDTVTRPTPGMRAAMGAADVGDDVYGEDPTVNRLEAVVADMLGKEAAIYVATGTQSNLIGLMSHCERGDEYIVGQQAHTYKYEGGGAAVLGSIQPQPVDNEPDGSLGLDRIAAAVKPDDSHFARTRLLALENTIGGKVLPMAYVAQAAALARSHGLGVHLDGARLFNAVVKLQRPVREVVQDFDTVSVCLSKGLGAPVGSVLAGPKALVMRARRWRKVLGGGMRQAGVMAAAGLYALEHHVERLAEDHENARFLAERLAAIPGVQVDPAQVQTNMVFMTVPMAAGPQLKAWLAERGMQISLGPVIRMVTHLDVNRDDMAAFADAVAAFFQAHPVAVSRSAAHA